MSMKLLRLTPALKATSSSYNQFSLGFKNSIDQTVGSLHKHEVSIDENIRVFHGDGSPFLMIKQIKRFIAKIEFDVIHIHNGLTGFLFILAIFPLKLGLLKKTVFTLHNSWNVLKIQNKFFNLIVILLANKVCTCGQSSHESLPKILSYFIASKTKAVINGFDNNRIDRVQNNKFKVTHFDQRSRIKILYVGGLTKTKNQIALLDVLNSTALDAELIFLGDGINKKYLIDFSKNISNSVKIDFKGLISRDSTIEHMLEADIFISLSKGEGLPIAVLEAMYSGCFMVLSTIPPHQEVSPPSERCLFVDRTNKGEIVNALNYVSNHIEKIQGEREISKDYAISKFGMKNMLANYREVYDSISKESK